MNRQLRAGADADLSGITVKDKFGKRVKVKLGAGEAGEIALAPTTAAPSHMRCVAKRVPPCMARNVSRRGGRPTVQEQLRSILAQNAVRVIDLFRDWDEDQSGAIRDHRIPPRHRRARLRGTQGGHPAAFRQLRLGRRRRHLVQRAQQGLAKAGADRRRPQSGRRRRDRAREQECDEADDGGAPRECARGAARSRPVGGVATKQRCSSPRSRPQTSASASGSSRGGGGGAAAAASPRSFKRAALLFAHHYAASSSAKSQSGGAGQVASDDVMDAVERHEAADRRRRRSAHVALARRHGVGTKSGARARRRAAPPQPSERALLSQLLGTNSEFGTYPPYVKPQVVHTEAWTRLPRNRYPLWMGSRFSRLRL